MSLDLPVPDGRGGLEPLAETLEDRTAPSLFELTTSEMWKQAVVREVDALTEREDGIIRDRFGFTTGDTMTLDEISHLYGVTRERIRQNEKKAISRLREPAVVQRVSA